MKVYIAGKITGLENYKELFSAEERRLREKGYTVMNPSILPNGFEYDEYMRICYSMIDVCDGVYFLNNWTDSKGAKLEHEYALKNNMAILYQREEAEE